MGWDGGFESRLWDSLRKFVCKMWVPLKSKMLNHPLSQKLETKVMPRSFKFNLATEVIKALQPGKWLINLSILFKIRVSRCVIID